MMKGITVFFSIAFCAVFVYAFFGIGKYVVTFSQVFRNAIVFTVQNLLLTIVQIILLLLIALATYLANILAFPVWVLLLYLMAKIYVRIFRQTAPGGDEHL